MLELGAVRVERRQPVAEPGDEVDAGRQPALQRGQRTVGMGATLATSPPVRPPGGWRERNPNPRFVQAEIKKWGPVAAAVATEKK